MRNGKALLRTLPSFQPRLYRMVVPAGCGAVRREGARWLSGFRGPPGMKKAVEEIIFNRLLNALGGWVSHAQPSQAF